MRGCASVELRCVRLTRAAAAVDLNDLNDFDETLPGPFEWDVKRMAASFTIAGRNNGFTKADTRAATLASVTAYREAMATFAEMGTMAIWYAHLSEDELLNAVGSAAAEASKAKKTAKEAKGAEKRALKVTGKERTAIACTGRTGVGTALSVDSAHDGRATYDRRRRGVRASGSEV